MSDVHRIGLIGAMDEEIKSLEQDIQGLNEKEIAGILFYSGTLHGKNIVLCRSGVGKVNAAVCTQILVDHFQVSQIIFTGVAGALHPSLHIGDIVISEDCIQHDMDVRVLGYAIGEIPYAETSCFTADEGLVDKAYRVSTRLFPSRVLKGRVLSGDQFIADREKVHFLHQHLEGACTEMEGAAVAQVCSMNRIPFVIIRSMSDNADGSAPDNFAEFTAETAKHSRLIVEDMLKEM